MIVIFNLDALTSVNKWTTKEKTKTRRTGRDRKGGGKEKDGKGIEKIYKR